MTPNYLVWILVGFGVLLGFGIGFAFRGWLRDKVADEANDQKRTDRQLRRQQDTAKNIGNRFARIVRGHCLEGPFLVETTQNPAGFVGYYDITARRNGGERVLYLRVDLSNVEEAQISGTLGGLEDFRYGIDEESVGRAIDRITHYLRTFL